MSWQRPASVPVGQVWSRFQGRERDGRSPLMYQIRDMEPQHQEQCLDLMTETFLRDEPLCDILGVTQDHISIATIRDNWRHFISQGVSLACFTEQGGEPQDLVGFNILLVKSQDDEEEDISQVKGESWRKLLLTLTTAESLVDVFAEYNVRRYLTSSGLTVEPSHRGQNIAARIFDARKPLCRALGLEASATVFTAITSQVLAAKCGYSVLAELPYSKMAAFGVDLARCSTPSAKLMGIKFQFDR